jgi:Protein of unknown function (DUF1588)/Protein of unknown function (DUF1592)/Protein of unknown function (DUF1585)/Protein of unknown function (DUF1595)
MRAVGYGVRTGLLALAIAIAQAGCGQVDLDTSARPDPSAALITATGTADAGDAPGAVGHPSADAPSNTSSGQDAGAINDAGDDDNGEVPLECTTPQPGPSPLSRLGNTELNRSLRAFLPSGAAQDELQWLPEGSGLDDPTMPLSGEMLETFHNLAHDIARLLVEDPSSDGWFASCDVDAEGEAACRDQLTESLLERAYRRAVTSEDLDEMAQVFADGKALGGDFASGMRAVAEVALLSPDFAYLVELGNGEGVGEAIELTSYETAARLSYFLTGSAPDAELFDAAQRGALDSQGLAAQARRLLTSAESRENVTRLYLERLGFDDVRALPELGFTDELALASIEASRRFFEAVTFDGAGTFGALLTEPFTWTNEPLATFYGYPGVTGENFQKVPLDPSRGVGLFAQPAFLSGTSHGDSTSPVQRGLRILNPVLCYEAPLPPADITSIVDEPPVQGTTRQRLESATKAAECQDCHRHIDPVGFAFEHYDAVGKWRDLEGGLPIDTSGELLLTDAKGPFRDAAELMQRIAQSKDAKACFVTQWLGRAYRRAETPEDACAKQELTEAFAQSGGNIVELLTSVVQTDNFKYRLKSELVQ